MMSLSFGLIAIAFVFVMVMILGGILTQFAAIGGFFVMLARGLERDRAMATPGACSYCGGPLAAPGPCPACGAPAASPPSV